MLAFRPLALISLLALAPLQFGCGGGSATTTQTPLAAPTAIFTCMPAAPVVGQAVQFQDASSGGPTSWAWAFGDGSTSTSQNPSHTYGSAGTYTVTLTVSNAGGSNTLTRSVVVSSVAVAPTSSFTFSPAAPLMGQVVSFTDTSTGSPIGWAWAFGDGETSSAQNPTHAFTSAGTYSVTLTAQNSVGSNSATRTVTVTGGSTAFNGTIVLGAPTQNSVKAKVFSADQSGTVVLQYGVGSAFDKVTTSMALVAGTPLEIALTGLTPDTRYGYRLLFTPGNGGASTGPMAGFRTARPAGSTYTFTVQADSHMDENTDPMVYLQTLSNVLADGPDFHIDLGDTFMCEKHGEPLSGTSPPAPDAATVEARYQYERAHFGTLTHSAPLFLVNGNHEGEAGWAANGTAQSLAVWTTLARQRHFVNPLPDGFYTGDTVAEPFVGQRASWYAWTWGDALFVVLDPFWNTPSQPGRDPWLLTLGDRQYQWLQQTLQASKAPFKFIFIHNLVGGLDGQMRGGIEAAPFFEWGGKNLDGTSAFTQKRPGWAMPLHALFVAHKVTAVFHGHDHLYAREELDGIIYQEVPQPSAKNFQSGPALAKEYHYNSGTILSSSGHLRVTVTPTQVTAQYVRTWLSTQENGTRKNGQVDHTWSVQAPAGVSQ